jgi:uncharacterized membrane protein YhaH (DUF805 family)
VALIRFFAFNPRIGRLRWTAWLVAAVAIVWLSILGLRDAHGVALVAIYAGLGCATAKLATESVRRLHDCGQSGRRGIGPVLGIVALFLTAVLNSIGYGLDGVSSGALVLAIVALAVLLLRRGAIGENAFGPTPGLLMPNDDRRDALGRMLHALGYRVRVGGPAMAGRYGGAARTTDVVSRGSCRTG